MVVRLALLRTVLTMAALGAVVLGLPALLATREESEPNEHPPISLTGWELVGGLIPLLILSAQMFVLFLLYGRWRASRR